MHKKKNRENEFDIKFVDRYKKEPIRFTNIVFYEKMSIIKSEEEVLLWHRLLLV